jgi:hypothetical protein
VTELMKLMTKYRTHNHITQNTLQYYTEIQNEWQWGDLHIIHITQNTQKQKLQNHTEYTECTKKNHPYAKSQNTHTTPNNRFINAEKNQPKYT